MKFLYLKGINIFGPLEAGEIAKEDCFSEDLLVCPEDKAEQESAWKPVSCYEEFKNLPKDENSSVANPPVEENKQDVNPESVVPQQELSNQENKNISDDLPPLEDTKTDSTTFTSDEFSANFNEVMDELSSKNQKEDPGEGDIKDHTFRISNKEDNLLEDLPAHSLIGPEENQSSENEHKEGLENDVNNGVKEINDVQSKKDFLEISNNKIISSSDGRVQKRKSNDLVFMLSFVVLAVVAIALCMAFWNMMNDNKDASQTEVTQSENFVESEQTQEGYSANSGNLKQLFGEQETNEAVNQPKTISSEEQVIDIVKNTRLTNNRGSIGDYLDKVYGEDYNSSWSAKPFTDKVYIVEFFASQVRNEPFVYLFRVDMDQKKITGALNNITLDLLA